LPIPSPRFAAVNGWFYYSSGPDDSSSLDEQDRIAAHTLDTAAWRDEVARWFDRERPPIRATNLALQAEDVANADDRELAGQLQRAVAHFRAVSPLHFEHAGFDIAAGRLFQAAKEWGIPAERVAALLAGASPATAAVHDHFGRIAAALDRPPETIEDVRASAKASQALDDYLSEHGWRVIDGNDLVGPTVGERPKLIVAGVRARMTVPPSFAPPDVWWVRGMVPETDRSRFDELLTDARATYALRDDDNGLCFVWPLGLIRRGVLEAGRRLADRGRVVAPDDVFEATTDEIDALLAGSGPSAHVLAERRSARHAAALVDPPIQLGEDVSTSPVELPVHMAQLVAAQRAYHEAAGIRSAGTLAGLGIGDAPARGPARLFDHASDAIDGIEPGDVLIAVTTTCNLNSIFPLLAAVATEEGGLFSHTALLARELGIPAVVGASGLFAKISDGDIVEVDPIAGVVRVIERP
jgi:pyruvate,water dikinase